MFWFYLLKLKHVFDCLTSSKRFSFVTVRSLCYPWQPSRCVGFRRGGSIQWHSHPAGAVQGDCRPRQARSELYMCAFLLNYVLKSRVKRHLSYNFLTICSKFPIIEFYRMAAQTKFDLLQLGEWRTWDCWLFWMGGGKVFRSLLCLETG